MSRGCHGKICICQQVAKWESHKRITSGKTINWLYGVNDKASKKIESDKSVDCTRVKLLHIASECLDGVHWDNECAIHALKLRPRYTLEELSELQQADKDILPVYNALKEIPSTSQSLTSTVGSFLPLKRIS